MTEERIHSPVGRVTFAHADSPAVYDQADGSKKEQYEVTLIWDEGTDLTMLHDLVRQAAQARWGQSVKMGSLKLPIRPNSDKEDTAGFTKPGYFAAFRSKFKPGVVLANAQPAPEGTIYSGCYARVSCSAWAYESPGNKGVRLNLNNIQFIRDGEPISSGGGVAATDDFEAYSE